MIFINLAENPENQKKMNGGINYLEEVVRNNIIKFKLFLL